MRADMCKAATPAVLATIIAGLALSGGPLAGPTLAAQSAADTAWLAPPAVQRQTNPVLPTTDIVSRGRELYVFACAQCHGSSGRGDGAQVGALRKAPLDLASRAVQSRSDGTLFWQIATGRGEMPKTTLDGEQVWDVVAYIRTLAALRRP